MVDEGIVDDETEREKERERSKVPGFVEWLFSGTRVAGSAVGSISTALVICHAGPMGAVGAGVAGVTVFIVAVTVCHCLSLSLFIHCSFNVWSLSGHCLVTVWSPFGHRLVTVCHCLSLAICSFLLPTLTITTHAHLCLPQTVIGALRLGAASRATTCTEATCTQCYQGCVQTRCTDGDLRSCCNRLRTLTYLGHARSWMNPGGDAKSLPAPRQTLHLGLPGHSKVGNSSGFGSPRSARLLCVRYWIVRNTGTNQ